MADIVALTIEGMVPELSHLERRGFFSSEEVREILAIREEMEYRMIKNQAAKSDFLKAIVYEMELVG